MDGWQIASSVATIVQALVVTGSLYLIWRQVRQQTIQVEQQTNQMEAQYKLIRGDHTQALFELASPFNMQVIQDRNVAKLIFSGHSDYDSFDEVDKFRYRASLAWRLTFQEMMYFQNVDGLLDENVYRSWEDDFKAFIKRRQLRLRWAELQSAYAPSFRDYVNKAIKAIG